MTAFTRLKRAYEDRHGDARSARREGQKVIGHVGAAFPREIVLAAGALPIAVTASRGRATPQADRYIEPVVPTEIRELFEAAVDGELSELDLLVITRPYAKLYYYLKEIYRQGRAPRMPKLHMFDLMQSRRDAVVAYNEGRFSELMDAVARVTEQQPGVDAIARAAALMERVRDVQRRLVALRSQSAISGVDALIATGAGYFMQPTEYEAALRSFVASLVPQALQGRPRWLVVSSEPLSDSTLHATLEEAGALIVAEDDAWGARAAGDELSAELPLFQALFQKTCFDTATGHVWPPELRENWFERQLARSDVDAVVFYVPPSDRQFGWDYPRLKGRSEQAGKRTLLIRDDTHTRESRERIGAAARALRDAGAAQRTLA